MKAFMQGVMADLPPMLFAMSGTLFGVACAVDDGGVTVAQLVRLGVVILGAALIAQAIAWRK